MIDITKHAEPTRMSRVWNSELVYSFRHNSVALVSMFVFLAIALAAILAP